MPTDSKWLKATLAGIADEWGDAAIAGTGGSIPIIPALQKYLGADALMVGFANFDNRIHSPNEKYDLSSYHKGIRSWVRILEKLADGMTRRVIIDTDPGIDDGIAILFALACIRSSTLPPSQRWPAISASRRRHVTPCAS